ncbi:MAG: SufS family cysteine desulfurase [Solirubrobacteraceae bacterium]|nr:SufS family cysteine desulfurase [Solirubrobacteraceae bacterium]
MGSVTTLTPSVASEFPVLDGNPGLAYLDSAATSQTPRPVLDAMADYYETARASVHRGVYPLAVESTNRFEGARERIAAFVGGEARSTVVTRNATEAINLVAYAWGSENVGAGDVIVVTELEHHSNLVPWQMLAQRTGARLAYVPVDDDGKLDLGVYDDLLRAGGVKLVGVAHVSNVLGTINPVAEMAGRAHEAGAAILIDGSQAVPQFPVDLAAIDADFYAWTGHKAYGPTGVGVLHGRYETLATMPPFLGGGHMISRVERDVSTYAEPPMRFEAGTSNIAEVIGLGAAVDFLDRLGMDNVRAHEHDLTAYALERLAELPGITIHGGRDADERGAVISFAVDGVHPHDVGEILGSRDVCVRAGHHCAQILMKRLGAPATTRASFGVHSTREEVDALVTGLAKVQEIFA